MKKIDWRNMRKWAWPLNVLSYNYYKLFTTRDKTLWVFGSRDGLQYDDNSKYLFEYVNTYHPNINAVWLCSDIELCNHINALGYKGYTINSRNGIRVAKKAGVAIYTHGLSDFGTFPKVGGAMIVSLWHGVGFKKIYNLTYNGFYKYIKRLMDCLFSWTWRDVTIVTSEFTRKQFIETFNIEPKDTFITGQPRNDVFNKLITKQDVFNVLNIDFTKNFILYMPTYRGFGMKKGSVTDIIKELYYNDNLNNTLNTTNSVFITKLHPCTEHIDLINRENFIILPHGAVKDNQSLLAVSDILITDYSSCVVDFSLRKKPVIFYMPDEQTFIKNAEPLFDEFFDISNLCKSITIDELCEKISDLSTIATDAINVLFEDPSIKGTCYCENVYNAIAKEVGL